MIALVSTNHNNAKQRKNRTFAMKTLAKSEALNSSSPPLDASRFLRLCRSPVTDLALGKPIG